MDRAAHRRGAPDAGLTATALLAPPARFTALVTAVSVAAFGSFLNLVALSLFTYAVTGSAWGPRAGDGRAADGGVRGGLVLDAGNSVSNVCVRASVPDLVPEEENARSNGRLVTWRALAVIAGYASASTIIAFGGFGLAFSVNAASFAFARVDELCAPRAHVQTSGSAAGVPQRGLAPLQVRPSAVHPRRAG